MGQQSSSRYSHAISPLPYQYLPDHKQGVHYLFASQSQQSSPSQSQDVNYSQLNNKEKDSSSKKHSQERNLQYLPSYVKECKVVINRNQFSTFLNHLAYRNQKQFSEFLIQLPFGAIEDHSKNGYYKLSLFSEEILASLNLFKNIPFEDMLKITYCILVGFRYLHSYYGLFKIQPNMVKFNRKGQAKVWLNRKITASKCEPHLTNINLKRIQQEESYMVNDILAIFWDKVDQNTVPLGFDLLKRIHSNSSRLLNSNSEKSYSRIRQSNKPNKTMKELEEVFRAGLQRQDFSDGGFETYLKKFQGYLRIDSHKFGTSLPISTAADSIAEKLRFRGKFSHLNIIDLRKNELKSVEESRARGSTQHNNSFCKELKSSCLLDSVKKSTCSVSSKNVQALQMEKQIGEQKELHFRTGLQKDRNISNLGRLTVSENGTFIKELETIDSDVASVAY